VFPLRDDQPRTTKPYVTYSIIVVNLAVFAYEIWIGMQGPQAWYAFLTQYGEVPQHFQLAFQGSSQYTIDGAFPNNLYVHVHARWMAPCAR
jgi:membrane associated rhomboid family serine protease